MTTYDNVQAQYRLLTEEFGIERIRLVSSWSMGASQSYAWAAAHPDMVDAIAPISGSARTATYNKTFLASLRTALTSDAAYNDGFYTDKPPIKGIRTLAAIYAGWGFSEPFYREEVYKTLGANDLEQFIELFWEAFTSTATSMIFWLSCGHGGQMTSVTTPTSPATSMQPWVPSEPAPSS